MLYQKDAPGEWGQMLATEGVKIGNETLTMADASKIFLRSWVTGGTDVLFILHGLGAHSGWFIDMGNLLSSQGLSVYIMDHRGFGRSDGIRGHIENYQTYIDDVNFVADEIRNRHAGAKLFVLGHSMGGIFASHFAAKYSEKLAGVIFLNPWIQDNSRVPLGTLLAILWGGLTKSKRSWNLTGGPEVMTTNPAAAEMLNADPLWQRSQTSSFLLQILNMRQAVLNKARQITIPALVLQADDDKSVIPAASRKFYETLASPDKTWQTFPDYDHDSEFEIDRSQMDTDLLRWIKAH